MTPHDPGGRSFLTAVLREALMLVGRARLPTGRKPYENDVREFRITPT